MDSLIYLHAENIKKFWMHYEILIFVWYLASELLSMFVDVSFFISEKKAKHMQFRFRT